jgi:hypothetical protein
VSSRRTLRSGCARRTDKKSASDRSIRTRTGSATWCAGKE